MSTVLNPEYGKSVHAGFNLRTAMAEAQRCLMCHDAPCSRGCPAGTDPGKFIRSLRLHNVKGAVETIRENNIFAGSCAWVCPYDTLCEQECSRTGIDRPIEIGKLQRFLVEQEQTLRMRVLTPGDANGKKVVCIGAGPASLACAAMLRQSGFAVTIMEAAERSGGILSYGINPTRLPQSVVDYDIGHVVDLGVRFVFGKKISAAELPDLRAEYDAVFVGVGLPIPRKVDIPGIGLRGVVFALDYLRNARSGMRHANEEHVLVIGGGDVAMDCAASAHQLGAGRVKIVYRRTIAESPANREEWKFVMQLGIPCHTEFIPVEILGKDGAVCGLKCAGRDGYSEMTLKADTVIFAVGQEAEPDFSELKPEGNLFAGGDLVNGGKTVVQAVAEGKAAARAIIDFLR